MKLAKTDSQKMKYQALLWLRIQQRCPFIATEVGQFNADVFGVNEKKSIEIEVKVSRSDLIADFKKWKHNQYTGQTYGFTHQAQWIPNQFYFAVPEALLEAAKLVLVQRKAEKYGLIQLEGWKVVKRAAKLHEREPSNHIKFTCALRMGSELIRFHEAWV